MDAESFLDAKVHWQETPAARLAYRKFGTGPAIVFTHGWPLCGFTFRKLVPYLADHFTLYIVDVPGGGDTEWTSETDFTWPGQASTIRAFIDGIGLEEYVSFGQDSGAMIARELARIDPRMTRLIMTNTEIPHHRPPFMRAFRAAMFLPGINLIFRALLRWKRFVRTKMGFGAGFVDRELIDGDFYEGIIRPMVVKARRMLGHNYFLRGWSWSLLDKMETLHAEIEIPVQLIWGAQDKTFPLSRAQEMIKQFPDCRGIHEVDGACVFVHEEKPAEVAAEVIRFAQED